MNLTDGVSFTVNVNNTLSGATTLYDDCSGTNVRTLWDYKWHDGGDESSQWTESYRTPTSPDIPTSNIALPHTRNLTKYLCGGHFSVTDGTGLTGGTVFVGKVYTRPAFPFYEQWAWWERVDPAWSFGATDHNFKWYAYGAGTGPYPLPNNWYAGLQTNSGGGTSFHNISSNCEEDGWNDDSTLTGLHTKVGLSRPNNTPNPASVWTYKEMFIKTTNASDGLIRCYISTAALTFRETLHYVGAVDPYSGTTRTVGPGGFVRDRGQNNWRYWADIYYDRQTTHVGALVLTNHATYASGTRFAHQPRTSRTATTVTCTCRAGIHTDGTVHMHWRDEVNGNQYLGTHTLGDEGEPEPQDTNIIRASGMRSRR